MAIGFLRWRRVLGVEKAGLLGRLALASILALLPAAAQAQTTLQNAVLIASEIDPGINALRHEIASKTVGVQAARDERYPKVSLSADTASSGADGAGLTLTVSQVIYDWGRVKQLIASASQDRVIAVAEMKKGTEQLTLDVSNYFIDVESLDRKIARTKDYLAFARRIAGHAEARANAGRGNRGEVARARLEVTRAEEQMSQLQSDRILAISQLEFLMGRHPGRLFPAPELGFASRYSSADAVASPVRLSPEQIKASARLAKAEADIGLAKASRLPSIQLQAQVRSDFDRGRTKTAVGLSTGVNLGAGAITGRQVELAKLQTDAARENANAVARNLTNGVRSSLERIRLLRSSEGSQQAQLGQSEEVLANYEQQFVGGQRELIDLLTTGRDLYDAQVDLIDTFDERKRTEYQAAFDLGVLGSLILASSNRG